MSSFRRASSRTNRPVEGNENEFDNPADLIPLPLPRTPLNSIPDPSQNPREGITNESDPAKADQPHSSTKGTGGTPRSAQSTPTKTVSRIHCGNGGLGCGNGGRPPSHAGARERGSSSKATRGVPDVKSCLWVQVPHFELEEDPLFWTDHNVQVLIRIRPISSGESSSQGHGRCLRQESSQTLTWTGNPETRFTFDHIACETISQETLFRVVGVPMVENCMSGYNSCMFAYGQTGSGKTYTMMGEMDNSLCEDRGMTPRIFEYMFMRIREEEENRRSEKLKYSCKCSFLEIYNEQITDLLDPSSNNVQLREDMKKGVYVENLREYDVNTVKDVVELLLQGAANRKMAATNMNSESSRSHSVFTCSIESRWEKDSMVHLRFGRLNLVDLAGSERQKSSGAEGERLKEAANINRSLSTLGLVIMTLVDIANGKHRHVPYRDSRLTFLLQDSLGGNSKTTIIANVSPSICSANETLSTLKFAQRAKLIQNNAKVNEDASGDVMALQREIQKLKDQLTILIKHQNVPMPLSCPAPSFELTNSVNFHDDCDSSIEGGIPNSFTNPAVLNQKMKYLEATLAGALRREKMAEVEVRRLEAEIEHMKRLVHQLEDDYQRTKMMLRLRDEKIRRLELLADGLVSGDEYLMEENNALNEETQLLRARIDRNPELTRFALENVRLLEQLRMFQDFYQHGEREILLVEVSGLRNQLLKALEEGFWQAKFSTRKVNQDDIKVDLYATTGIQLRTPHVDVNSVPIKEIWFDDTIQKLGHCRKKLGACLENNAYLTSEDDDPHYQLKPLDSTIHNVEDSLCGDSQRIKETAKSTSVDLTLVENGLGDEVTPFVKVEEVGSHLDADQMIECRAATKSSLHAKLGNMHMELEAARILNKQFQHDHASQLSHHHEMELTREQVEVETAQTILNLQEELAALQQEVYSGNASHSLGTTPSVLLRTENQELQERLCLVMQENVRLSDIVAARDAEIIELAEEWEKAIIDLSSFLFDGCQSMEDASVQIDSIMESFPQRKTWINEHVERAIKVFIEKERSIVNLQKRLEDAQKIMLEMTSKLNSLKGATLAITEVQQLENDENTKELLYFRGLLSEKTSKIRELENSVKCKEIQIIKAEKRANAAFIAIKMLNEMTIVRSLPARAANLMINETENKNPQLQSNQSRNCELPRAKFQIPCMDNQWEDAETTVPELKLSLSVGHDKVTTQEMKSEENNLSLKEIGVQVEIAMQRVLESDNVLCAFFKDTENYLSTLISDIHDTSSAAKRLLLDLINEICTMKKNFMEMKERNMPVPVVTVESLTSGVHELRNFIGPYPAMQLIRNELTKTKERLRGLKVDIENLFGVCGKIAKQENDVFTIRDSTVILRDHDLVQFKRHVDNLIQSGAGILHLREEVESAFDGLMEIHNQFGMLIDEIDDAKNSSTGHCSPELVAAGTQNQLLNTAYKDPSNQFGMQVMCHMLQALELRIVETDADCFKTREIIDLNLRRLTSEIHDSGLLLKFEEAQETMKEADLVLNELLKANENAKHETDRWKKASEELLIERTALTAEVQRLRASTFVKDEQYDILGSEIHANLLEILDSMSSLEGSFRLIQNNTRAELKAIFSDIFLFGQEVLECISTSSSWLETQLSEIMRKSFALSVLYQCHAGAFLDKLTSFNLNCDSVHYRYDGSTSAFSVIGKPCGDIKDSLRSKGEDKGKGTQVQHPKYEVSGLGGTLEVLNMFQELPIEPFVDTDTPNFDRPDVSHVLKYSIERVAKLEKEKADLINDIKLVKGAIDNKAGYLEKFIKELASHCEPSTCGNLSISKEVTQMGATVGQSLGSDISISLGASHSDACIDLGLRSHIIQDSIVTPASKGNDVKQDVVGGATTDIEIFLTSIQHLRAQCDELVTLDMAKKNTSRLTFQCNNGMQGSTINRNDVHIGQTGLLNYIETKTEYGNQLMHALNELGNNLSCFISSIHPVLYAENEANLFSYLLELLFQGICNIQEKVYKFLVRSSRDMVELNVVNDHMSLKRELARKDVLLKGLLFDFRLLQESTSNAKDIKDETEQMIASLSQVQHELSIKTAQVDEILIQRRDLESQLANSEAAVSSSRSELKETKETLAIILNENTELRLLLEDVCSKKMDAEEQLKHQKKVIDSLEKEIVRMNNSIEERILSSVEEIVDELRMVSDERDHLQTEVVHLINKLDTASALADENEAVAVEARQVAEASKIYAEHKEEEVKVLECSVEELEGTINVLEKKVYDMGEEVERYRLMREDLEQELQVLRQRMFTVETATENLDMLDSDIEGACQIPRQIDDIILELHESKKHIEDLQKESAYQAEEIKQYREHISELILHSEAQSSLYQQKFQTLENMVYEAKTDPSISNSASSVTNKTEKTSLRTRGSGSPFKCISGLVQQMNTEKDQELTVARLRIEELEALAANRQKQVCMLTARLAAVDNMTHDVIRDLLEVKLDMTNYADLIDQEELQKLLENAQQQAEENNAKDQEILKLTEQINGFNEERDSWIEKMKADILESQVTVERLQQRDQLLTAQNEMLKMDKANLTAKIAELDELLKKLVGSQSIQELLHQPRMVKENSFLRRGNVELTKRLAESDRLLSRSKNELVRCSTSNSNEPFDQCQ